MSEFILNWACQVAYWVTDPELIPLWVVYGVGFPVVVRRFMRTVE